jgi:hypothetical protein
MRCARTFRLLVGAIALMAAAVLPCLASQVAVLKNGFSIRHEWREVVGNMTRLYVNADGSSYVDVATADIEHFEAAPDLPAPVFANRKNAAPDSSTFFPGGRPDRVPSGAQPPVNLDQVVSDASARYRLDPDFVNSVIKAESGFNVRAVSPKGAQGLMQLMPGTASQLGVSNAFDPRANVEGGTRYLRELLERYNFDLVKALAAYNAGPQRVEQFGGVPPYYETQAYVARVVRDFNKKKIAQRKNAANTPTATNAKPSSTGTRASAAKSASNPHVSNPAHSNQVAQAKATVPAQQ